MRGWHCDQNSRPERKLVLLTPEGFRLEEQGVEVHTPWLHKLVIVFPGPYLQGDRQIEQSGNPADVYESLNLGSKNMPLAVRMLPTSAKTVAYTGLGCP